jgi:transcriptional regulator of arginine metabolism
MLRLVGERHLATQSELVRALRGAGFPATQATVSRDVEELGLVKIARDGGHAYAAPEAVGGSGGLERLRRFCEDYPVEAARSGSLLVLRSLPGSASALAAAMDAARFPESLGTLAGDDTVFVALRDRRSGRTLGRRLAELGIRERSP